MSSDVLPPLAALFIVVFDQRAGYTIAWQRTNEGLDIDGVEFQCLPSGLHSIKRDLVYFVHGGLAGISAFVQGEADESQRHANFVAVGALMPFSNGRAGRSWLHAPKLRLLARDVVRDSKDFRALEEYWTHHARCNEANGEATSGTTGNWPSTSTEPEWRSQRSRSDASHVFTGSRGLPADHPASAMTELLDTFGPLVFPLYRAALLRNRILLLGPAPVQQSCNFVYLLSILSSIPRAQIDVVGGDSEGLLRSQPIFNVGIHDIPHLSDRKKQDRWLACTTDDILAEKKDVYDVLLKKQQNTADSLRRPTMNFSDSAVVKATQRDLRRYRILRAQLDRLQSITNHYHDAPTVRDEDNLTVPLLRKSTTSLLQEVKRSDVNDTDIVEPVSWSAMAYNGFMWWASAGEMDAWEHVEVKSDRQLLDDLPEMDDFLPRLSHSSSDEDSSDLQAQAVATIVTAYFRRLTAQMLQSLAKVVEEADDETEEGVADATITISINDVQAMGLDGWSTTDVDFAMQMMKLYFRKETVIEASGTRICGVRVC